MVYLNTILESLMVVCRQSSRLPSAVTYATIEFDTEDHGNIKPPTIEFTIEDVERDTSRNTEWVGAERDDDGTQIGYRFTRWYTASVNAQVQTVSNTKYTHRDLAQRFEETLAPYETPAPHQIRRVLPDPDNPEKTISDVDWLYVQGYENDNDFSMSPSTRERSIPLEIGFTHEISTSDLGIEYGTVEEVDLTTYVCDPESDAEYLAEPSEPITD